MTLKEFPYYEAPTHWAGANAWVVQLFVVVFCVLLLNLVVRIMVNRLYKRLQQNSTPWDDAVVGAIQRPLNLLVWVVGIAFAAEIAKAETASPIFNAIGPVRDVGVIAAIAWFLLRLTRNMQQNIIQQNSHREERKILTCLSSSRLVITEKHNINAIYRRLSLQFKIRLVPARFFLVEFSRYYLHNYLKIGQK